MLADRRQRYWIVDARRAIRRILNTCVACKRRDGAGSHQQMADLPADRVIPDYVFSSSGFDYFGPFLVKRRGGTEKRNGCIFTSLVTRAVHIEVAHSLEASSFINCLHRFVSKRSCAKILCSDQGTNFVGAE